MTLVKSDKITKDVRYLLEKALFLPKTLCC
nr:MAG TPA_asm: hypothetical protein [Caudoviricetes sp.]